jgi:hypothetical protein
VSLRTGGGDGLQRAATMRRRSGLSRLRALLLLAACAALFAGTAGALAASAASARRAKTAVTAPEKRKRPVVSGALQVGHPLSAGAGVWKGTAPISYAYQWLSCVRRRCATIPGATEATYTPTPEELGDGVRVIVTAENAYGSASNESRASKRTIVPGPPVNVAAPAVSGVAEDGQTLTAGEGTWSSAGPLSYGYQWELCDGSGEGCEQIAGADEATISLVAGDVGSTLRVLVTATNGVGSSAASSSATSVVAAALPSSTGLPSIAGSLVEGGLLTASTGSWTGTPPLVYSYQWESCPPLAGECFDIPEATSSQYRPGLLDVGDPLRVIVTATNDAGSASATSPATSVVAALLPSSTGLPSVVGSLVDGGLLQAVTGSWSGTAPLSYGYEWELCNSAGEACKKIAGAGEALLSLVSGDVGSTLRVVVTATNQAGSTSATSPATSVVSALLPSDTALPSITGSLVEGGLLKAVTGSWSGTAPLSYSYEWELCNSAGEACKEISGAAEAVLSLVAGDIGSTLRVVVTATNAAGPTSATSPATGVVAALLPSNTALPSIKGLLKVGQLLTALTGSWTGTAPITYGYQWELCNLLGKECVAIAKATGPTYLLSLLDVALPLRVTVTASNIAGSVSATSGVTGLVEALL